MASARKQNKSGRIRSVLYIIMVFFIGYFTANFFSFSEVWQWISTKKILSSQLASAEPRKAEKPIPKPKFEFYTLLTEDNKTAPHPTKAPRLAKNKDGLATVKEAKGKKALPSTQDQQFFVQAASFRHQKDADRLKAKLALNGFEVRLLKVQSNGVYWYRVMLGPFDNQINAEKAQTKMAQLENIMGVLRKEPRQVA